ncbi:MAG: deoxyribodipyrimidine photo-lyase, partial [Bdellovibrionales bacterium]
MAVPVTLLWLRRDLRLSDHPALSFAASRGRVVPVYILDDTGDDPWAEGAAARWWLHRALSDLSTRLEKFRVPLILRRGDPLAVLETLLEETQADCVVWSRRTEPFHRKRDKRIEQALTARGVEVWSFNASLLFEPSEIQNKSGKPFKVFTPFSKACFASPAPQEPLPAPRSIKTVNGLASACLEDWGLCPTSPNWAEAMGKLWPTGEIAAHRRLAAFVREGLKTYHADRDRPDKEGVSRLSPYLQNGQISARQIWYVVQQAMAVQKGALAGAECFLKELLWREFSAHLLYHQPHLPEKPLQESFVAMKWRRDKAGVQAWQQGLTGYPIVDAGMRQLWRTGWMHNRVRMIVASFFIKDLLISWREGEAWFWDTLVDADLANNAASWQWVAGCGADAAPYFRVFN